MCIRDRLEDKPNTGFAEWMSEASLILRSPFMISYLIQSVRCRNPDRRKAFSTTCAQFVQWKAPWLLTAISQPFPQPVVFLIPERHYIVSFASFATTFFLHQKTAEKQLLGRHNGRKNSVPS